MVYKVSCRDFFIDGSLYLVFLYVYDLCSSWGLIVDFEETKNIITLHGLGFLQVKLEGNQRINVWHPDLPRRKCFEHSNIHNHRFGFVSRVLIGTQININYKFQKNAPHTHTAYLHEGKRTKFGNRPWDEGYNCKPIELGRQKVEAGGTYKISAYEYHATQTDGIVVTLMKKVFEGDEAATSLCEIGVKPDVDFDRFQLSDNDMWEFFNDAMCHANKN